MLKGPFRLSTSSHKPKRIQATALSPLPHPQASHDEELHLKGFPMHVSSSQTDLCTSSHLESSGFESMLS